MSNLTLAKKFHNDSGRSEGGRKLELRFRDLRNAVGRIIAHLEKLERAHRAYNGVLDRKKR